MAWVRGEDDEYPKTYARFEGKKVDQNGNRKQYWIQDLTVDLTDSFIDELGIGFLKDELLSRYTKIYESPEVLLKYKTFQKENFTKKASLVCLTKDEQGAIQVAGLNSMHVKCIGEKVSHDEYDDPPIIVKIVQYLYKQKDPFKELNIDKYLNAVGLYVFPEFRGEGIGQEILKARKLLCQHLGIRTSLTFFTSYISQGMAEKSGFKDFFTIDYDKLPEDMLIPKLHEHTKAARLMYINYW